MQTSTLIEALEEIRETQAKLISLIREIQDPPSSPTVLVIPQTRIVLNPGERYAGPVLNVDGSVKHHLVLAKERPSEPLSWQAAVEMLCRQEKKLDLPSRDELALLYASYNLPCRHFYLWSGESEGTSGNRAWSVGTFDGRRGLLLKTRECGVVLIRRIFP